jgi:hypothetical protein
MDADGMIKRIKNASRNIFLALNDSGLIKKKYVEPHVFVRINGKKVKIKDITVSECNIYLETEDKE